MFSTRWKHVIEVQVEHQGNRAEESNHKSPGNWKPLSSMWKLEIIQVLVNFSQGKDRKNHLEPEHTFSNEPFSLAPRISFPVS